LWSSYEHDRRAASITLSKRVGQIQQLAQSFDGEDLRVRNPCDGLLAIGVRPPAREPAGSDEAGSLLKAGSPKPSWIEQ